MNQERVLVMWFSNNSPNKAFRADPRSTPLRLWFKRTELLSILLLIPVLFLNCPKRMVVKTTKIEVLYLSSIYEDIQREKPFLSGIKNLNGIKVGYLNFDTPFLPQLFQRFGFYELLNEFPLDFLVTNYPVYGYNFLSIPESLGYGIKNYKGIRFGIFSKNKDSLTISEQTKLALVKERTDVLWVIDHTSFSMPPVLIEFLARERILQDTVIRRFVLEYDSVLLHKIKNFTKPLNSILSTEVYLGNRTLKEFIFSEIKDKQGVNLIIYPPELFKEEIRKGMTTIIELLRSVNCEMKFKRTELGRVEVKKILQDKKYLFWGNIEKKNHILIPDRDGEYLFDLLFPRR